MNHTLSASNHLGVGMNLSTWHAVVTASLVVQLILILLLGLSIACWAIMFAKRKQFSSTRDANEPFEDAFWKAASLDDIFENLKNYPGSSLANVFRAGYLELRKIADSNLADKHDDKTPPLLSGIDNLQRALTKAIDHEIGSLESSLNLLATTGSTGPFIGLFGTVWGIMTAFQHIGATGMASLAVVAPGIAEALITTAIGLFAAIPATVAYNYFVTQIKKDELSLNSFSADFLNIAKRNFFRGQ